MSINDEIVEFLNRIISKAKTKDELIKNLNTYKDYLVLTEICDSVTLNFIGNIKNNADKIFELKNSFGTFDVRGVVMNNELSNEQRTIKTKTLKKHYDHYVHDDLSSCGTSSSSCSSSTYSDTCGSSSTYRGC